MKLNMLATAAIVLASAAATLSGCSNNRPDQWPAATPDSKPCARWWWMGSAVDSAGLKSLISQYADGGLGGLEICPIYGVKGNENADIDFLSPRWMDMYAFAVDEARKHGIRVDLTCGTGWPFGGPNITNDLAAACLRFESTVFDAPVDGSELVWNVQLSNAKARDRQVAKFLNVFAYSQDGRFEDLTDKVANDTLRWNAPAGSWTLYSLWHGRTRQAVKRSAPGGVGLVMDYFSHDAVSHYLGRFDSAFAQANLKFPQQMFSDSYEVYGADFTDVMFDAFEKMHGYSVKRYIPELLRRDLDSDTARRVKADYAETVDSLLVNNFMVTWTSWLRSHNSSSREQAHGSVANILDMYALSDVPECETYGRAKVQIRDLVVPDTFARKNESDKSIMKFASSAAHTQGKKFTSAESLTWASEHFRMTPAICKPELDALFLAGINRIYYHGVAYSPDSVAWPGYKFYASVDYSPTNVFWGELKQLNQYVQRSLTFLQAGKPDADVLVYFPLMDIWYNQNERCPSFSIEHLQVYAADYLRLINDLEAAGLQTDYISDRQILRCKSSAGLIQTAPGVSYKTILVPGARFMHPEVLAQLQSLAKNGATVIFSDCYPSDAPGLASNSEKSEMQRLVSALPEFQSKNVAHQFGNGKIVTSADPTMAILLNVDGVVCESMTQSNGLRYIRRRNNDGYTYFIANLDLKDVDASDVELAVDYADAVFYAPMTGKIGRVGSTSDRKIRVQLESGETVFVRTYDHSVDVPDWTYRPSSASQQKLVISNGWSLHFSESVPAIDPSKSWNIDSLTWWTNLPDDVCRQNSGVAVYEAKFSLPKDVHNAVLRLANVKETVSIVINGQELRSLWSFPYVLDIDDNVLREGENSILLSVRGMAANRIAQMDRDGIVWRRFKDTNLLDVKGKVRDYAWWPVEPMGLRGPVELFYDAN